MKRAIIFSFFLTTFTLLTTQGFAFSDSKKIFVCSRGSEIEMAITIYLSEQYESPSLELIATPSTQIPYLQMALTPLQLIDEVNMIYKLIGNVKIMTEQEAMIELIAKLDKQSNVKTISYISNIAGIGIIKLQCERTSEIPDLLYFGT